MRNNAKFAALLAICALSSCTGAPRSMPGTTSSSQTSSSSDSFFDGSSTSEPYIDPRGSSSDEPSSQSGETTSETISEGTSETEESSSKAPSSRPSSEVTSSASSEDIPSSRTTTTEGTSSVPSSEETSEEMSSQESEQCSDSSSEEAQSEATSTAEEPSVVPSSEENSSEDETSSHQDSSQESSSEKSEASISSEETSSEDTSDTEGEPSSSEESPSSELTPSSEDPSSSEALPSSEEPTSDESSSSESSSSQTSIAPAYDEEPDSTEDIDVSDLSGLYAAFATPIMNYTSTVNGYFSDVSLYDYYRHYQKNYAQDNTSLFVKEAMYRYPDNQAYLSVLNEGRIDLNGDAYAFSLQGDDVTQRLSSSVAEGDLKLISTGDSYHNHLFTLADFTQTFFESNGFTRVSKYKYQYKRIMDAAKDDLVFNAFLDICAPGLNNSGRFMTFSKATIEIDEETGSPSRIRLYAYPTNKSRLIKDHQKEEYPNWYLLFSETTISNIGSTAIHPLDGLLI